MHWKRPGRKPSGPSTPIGPPNGSRRTATRFLGKFAFWPEAPVLSRLFRGKFLAALQKAHQAGGLGFHGTLKQLRQPAQFQRLLGQPYRQEWVVYAKPPFGGPAQVLKYLARYTHRVAISNNRLLKLDQGRVTFRWKNYAQGNHQRAMTLEATEFLRRFLLHVLPTGFMKIRHYGFLANRCKHQKLARCRELLSEAPNTNTLNESSTLEDACCSQPDAGPDDTACCPSCRHGRMRVVERSTRPTIPQLLAQPWPWDTS